MSDQQTTIKFVKGHVYRNTKQSDVDFYVTNVRLYSVVGYWVTRSHRMILTNTPDVIKFEDINLPDWLELND